MEILIIISILAILAIVFLPIIPAQELEHAAEGRRFNNLPKKLVFSIPQKAAANRKVTYKKFLQVKKYKKWPLSVSVKKIGLATRTISRLRAAETFGEYLENVRKESKNRSPRTKV